MAVQDNLNSLREFLKQRARLLGGIVFSGGEALLHPLLPSLVQMAKEHELAVKIDSAGLLPDRLGNFLRAGSLDYVAIDLKTSPGRYNELGWPQCDTGSNKSAEYLLNATFSRLEESGIDYEIRTTVVPGLVGPTELKIMAKLARHAPRWIWQSYRKADTLNPDWSNLDGWDETELQTIACSFSEADNILIR